MNEIFERTSVRKFTEEPVSQKDVETILHAAMQAPSAVNQQPWEFYVVTNKEILDKLSKVAPHATPIANAPLGIVMVTKKNTIAKDYQMIDMGICSENIMLEAVSLGLGSVIIGIAPFKDRIEKVGEILDLPDTVDAFAVVAIGHPASSEKHPIEDRFDAERVHYIK